MALSPEIPQPQVTEIPQLPEIPPEIERGLSVQKVQKNFTAQVNDDKGQPLIQTPPTQVITVTPPGNSATFIKWSGGSITNSITWLGAFWLRILKKALHFGWHVSEKEES